MMNQRILLLFVNILFFFSLQVKTQPCAENYNYRRAIAIESSSLINTDYTGFFILNTQGLINGNKMKPDGSDIILYDRSGNLVPFSVEEGTLNAVATKIWFRKELLEEQDTLYLFYGNEKAVNVQHPQQVFTFYDDFNSLDSRMQWTSCAGNSLLVNGKVIMQTGSGPDTLCLMLSNKKIRSKGILEVKCLDADFLHEGTKALFSHSKSFAMGPFTIDDKKAGLSRLMMDECFVSTEMLGFATVADDYTGLWSMMIDGFSIILKKGTESLVMTDTTMLDQDSSQIILQLSGSNDRLTLDWLRIRDYHASEPIITLGQEQIMSATGMLDINTNSPVCEGDSLFCSVKTVAGASYEWKFPDGSVIPGNGFSLVDAREYQSGLYNLSVSIPGNSCSPLISSVNIIVDGKSQGGIVTGADTVCAANNAGVLINRNSKGKIIRWETSISGNNPWSVVSSTSDSMQYNELMHSLSFRAVVQQGVCSESFSEKVKITVVNPATSGFISGDTIACMHDDILLYLNEWEGEEIQWQYKSIHSWDNTGENKPVLLLKDLTENVFVRAIVRKGVCFDDTSETFHVRVSTLPQGGSVVGITECSGINADTLRLINFQGEIKHWEYFDSSTELWVKIENESDKLPYKNIPSSRIFRVRVGREGCDEVMSIADTVIVAEKFTAGILPTTLLTCEDSNSFLLKPEGFFGNIVAWQVSGDGSSWMTYPSALDTFRISNITSTTYCRVIVAGSFPQCGYDTSTICMLEKKIPPLGGIPDSAWVCEGAGKGVLKLRNFQGEVIQWESSITGQSPWYIISDNADSMNYHSLSNTTYFRVKVGYSVCEPTYSKISRVRVDKRIVTGELTGSKYFCPPIDSGRIELKKYSGSIYLWQQQVKGKDWKNILNTSSVLTYHDIQDTSCYRVILYQGVCPSDTSETACLLPNPLPIAAFVADTVVKGNPVHFTNNSKIKEGTIQSNCWDFGDESVAYSVNPSHLYQDTGKYNVRLSVLSDKGCSSFILHNVMVLPTLEVDFSFNNACLGERVQFMNLSNNDTTESDIYWSFGDGGFSHVMHPAHSYTKPGTYLVWLRVSNEYEQDSVGKEIIIHPGTRLSFEVMNTCSGHTTNFINTSSGNEGKVQYQWNVGDGSNSFYGFQAKHMYEAPGLYQVSLFSLNEHGCRDTLGKIIQVNPQPMSNFYTGKKIKGEPVVFVDSSTIASGKIASWTWSFGNGAGSVLQHPEVIYSFAGIYPVTLTVISDSGCSHSHTAYLTIVDKLTASFEAGNSCVGDTICFINHTTNTSPTSEYRWNFGDGSYSTARNPCHRYLKDSIYQVILIVRNMEDVDSVSNNIEINPLPVTSFSMNDVCIGEQSLFTNQSWIKKGAITDYYWDMGDGTTSSHPFPRKYYFNDRTYTVKLLSLSDKGCKSEVTHQHNVHPLPLADFSFEDGCFGDEVKFLDKSTGVGNTPAFYWIFGDGSSSDLSSPVHTYSSPGQYRVTQVLTTSHLCMDSVSKVVNVFPLPQIRIKADSLVFAGDIVDVAGEGGIAYTWYPPENCMDSYASATKFTINKNMTILVTGEDENACKAMDSLRIQTRKECRVFPCNVLTPDANGVNDTWKIENIQAYTNYTVSIYNRLGTLVYETNDYSTPWDGRNSNDDILPDGTYYYVIHFRDWDYFYRGALSILRGR